MWTIDCRCSLCVHKDPCPDRPDIIKGLTDVVVRLNTAPEHLSGPGDGILIASCHDFRRQ